MMDDTILFRKMRAGDEYAVSELIIRTFNKFIALGYSTRGVEQFLKGIRVEHVLARLQTGRLILVAVTKKGIVGIIEVKDYNHASLLFVDAKHHRKGIARGLLKRALAICQNHNPDITKFTVNSSPYAVHIYKKLGFQQLGQERVENGMRFTPMVLKLSKTAMLKDDEGG